MKKLITILGIVLLLTSCSNPKDLEEIAKLESKVESLEIDRNKFIFEKKKECLNLCVDIYEKENIETEYSYFDPVYFYNIESNSCYYEGGYTHEDTTERNLYNCFTKETELSYVAFGENVLTMTYTEFDNAVNKLKENK